MESQVLRAVGAIEEGHFRLSSGRHSRYYFEKFRLLERPELLGSLVGQLVAPFRSQNIQAVVGPTVGGVLVAYEAARQLGVRALYVEREEGQRVLRRGSTLEAGMRVLVVDDVLTTGTSIREMLTLIEALHALPIGIAVLIDRSETPLSFPYPIVSVWRLPTETYAPEECPLCRAGQPLTVRGSRHLER